MRTIEFIASHTSPGQTLFSGLDRHDQVLANDNLVYFATQRMPATRWSHFDPDLQSSYDVQTQMVSELKRNPPPYLVIDSEFDMIHEPNDSSRSSGVLLLDNYIHQNYEPIEKFEHLTIWKMRGSF